ncbi:MAG: polysaccharide deacetylase family protein [Alicyclobacillus sp.]|nr:polysaccharide deacetylase family protein [Alicyclobacillus sp.]
MYHGLLLGTAGALAAASGYALLPELLGKVLHWRTLWRGPASARVVALTFDDGPDPRYTPRLLHLLEEYGVRASFFVVGENARQHPHLIQRMLAAGHEVSPHGQRHRHAWLTGPRSAWHNVADAVATLQHLSGQPVRWYRPPWGAFNVVTYWVCRRYGLTPVLWSARAMDWRAGGPEQAQRILQRAVRRIRPGTVLLLHDAGGAPGAPDHTLAALPALLTWLAEQRFRCVTLSELAQLKADHQAQWQRLYAGCPGYVRLLRGLWQGVDKVFDWVYRVEPVNTLFRVGIRSWRWGVRRDEGGACVLRSGDRVLELHFQNDSVIAFAQPDGGLRGMAQGLRAARAAFQDLAQLLQVHPRYRQLAGVMAITLMHRGMAGLGFHVEDLPPSRANAWLQRYLRFLLGLHHPAGFPRLRQGRHSGGNLEPKLIWMSRAELLARYNPASPAHSRPDRVASTLLTLNTTDLRTGENAPSAP